MRHIIFECDGCGVKEETPADKPMSWTELLSCAGRAMNKRRFYCNDCWHKVEAALGWIRGPVQP